ncbi:hypothetical protein BHU72_12200 [Desulfuribacillus stibiiarsenatis]|uniref:Radical SAM core domain-containing protein n=1 Tax=Desulfuribacillus stibiiarsenatis TaxID=1390249 RepID=A0A1E5L1Y0_9FIRM|nr:radical SAM protein [Desulfuribacillus stibiiarsenatis]OEH84162.1 hypothetical protein BHU72_12200 [Desulfuribacillus stibiiarsenatis]
MQVKNTLYTTQLNSLKELWLHVTYQCNLTCTHCLFSCSPTSEANELSLDAAISHVENALSIGIEKLYITGGEPFMWSKLESFLTWYYKIPRAPLTILTNGTLIDDSKAAFLAKFHKQGLQLRISLECYLKENNDAVRGQGSFIKTTSAIRTLNSYGIYPWIAFTDKSNSASCCNKELETAFKNTLSEQHSIRIAGLKIISAYSKGRFAVSANHSSSFTSSPFEMNPNVSGLQCGYGLTVCAEGIAPCPILVDNKDVLHQGDLQDLIGNPINLNHSCCENCLTSGTTCGQ